ncbi:MAG TPA: glycosyltransferase family 10 [Chloroflexota bacterium]|nr:glycosyltransferase family 10 [Chloroflexota bacterium]
MTAAESVLSSAPQSKVALYIDPPSHHFERDVLFTVNDPRFFNGDSVGAPYVYVRNYFEARGIPVHTADLLPETRDGVRNVYVSFGMLDKYRRLMHRTDTSVSAFFALECPIVEPAIYRELRRAQHDFKRIFTWTDSTSLERFVGGPLRCERYYWPQAFDEVHEDLWSRRDRKFLCIVTNHRLPRIYFQELYTERVRAIAFFAQYNEIDLYGPGWNEPPYRVGRTRLPYTFKRIYRAWLRQWDRIHPDPLRVAARRVYRGVAASKSETIAQYTFALCFENMILRGWITEKIFDCFYSGTVPIYWGDPEVEKTIPTSCYVDMRQFSGYPELRAFLKNLTPAQIQGYRDAARAYLKSPQARPFTKDALVDIFRRIVQEDTGVTVA